MPSVIFFIFVELIKHSGVMRNTLFNEAASHYDSRDNPYSII